MVVVLVHDDTGAFVVVVAVVVVAVPVVDIVLVVVCHIECVRAGPGGGGEEMPARVREPTTSTKLRTGLAPRFSGLPHLHRVLRIPATEQ